MFYRLHSVLRCLRGEKGSRGGFPFFPGWSSLRFILATIVQIAGPGKSPGPRILQRHSGAAGGESQGGALSVGSAARFTLEARGEEAQHSLRNRLRPTPSPGRTVCAGNRRAQRERRVGGTSWKRRLNREAELDRPPTVDRQVFDPGFYLTQSGPMTRTAHARLMNGLGGLFPKTGAAVWLEPKSRHIMRWRAAGDCGETRGNLCGC